MEEPKLLIPRRKPLAATVGVMSIGLDTYWDQFPGLLEEMRRKSARLREKLEFHQVTVRDFGAFVEILPGVDGLLHISEMADYRVNKVTDICEEGQYVTVKVIDIDQAGKIRLSRKAALKELGE